MKKNHTGNKEYKLIHQILCITSIDFQRRTIYGFVELHILPLVPVLSRIKLNCKQCRIYRVCVKGSGLESWLEAAFLTDDPGNNVCPDGRKRNLDYFSNSLQNAVYQTEPDNNNGEITVRLPSETMPLVEEKKMLRLSIEFILDKPSSGVHFVVPNGNGSFVDRSCHMYSYKWGNSSRLWFPCIDSFSEICTWKIEVTVDTGMTVICPGELAEKIYTPDEQRVTHHFTQTIPTSACNIGIAVGPFEICPDQEMPDVTYFVLPGLKSLVKNTVSFLNDAFEFFEESLNTQYPYSTFKLVFVDEAFEPCQSFASMGILNTNLLHPSSIIEQPFTTRRIIVECLAEQFFGMFVSLHSWADIWLLRGIALYLSGMFIKKMFGNNEYRDWLHKELDFLCNYELDGPGLPPLYPFPLAAIPLDSKMEVKTDPVIPPQIAILQQHPHLISYKQYEMLKTKSHLVMRMMELRIGQDLLLQACNKVLSLASSAAAKRSDSTPWCNMLLSTTGFLKTISTVSGKDINIFVDQWICHTGVAKFNASFSFNRKRNIVELEITQYCGKGCQKYVGPLIVCIQELDGSFSHTVQVEDTTSHHELPCHSKSRRNKKKKIPLITGEEVDMDLSATFDTDSPVLWIRIDPDMTWPRLVSLQQPDYMWQYQLRYERDVTSQVEAVRALQRYPCAGTRSALIDIINQNEAFYKVRTEAARCLAKVGTVEAEVWDGESSMIEIFEKMFGSNAAPRIPRFNDFSNFISYFLQKCLPQAIATMRNVHSQCSNRVITFILDLLKYNDNRFNQFSDAPYVSSLIDALATTIGPAIHLASSVEESARSSLPHDTHAKNILKVVNRRLNMDKILPSYRYCISSSCLKAIRSLQVNGHIPAESQFFKKFAQYGIFEDVRKTALQIMVDFTLVQSSEKDLEWILDIVEQDPVPSIRHHVVSCLIEKPPFTKKATNSSMNNSTLVERLWQLMNCDSANDHRLRTGLVDLYDALWGRVTPACVPSHGFGIVIDLKGKNAVAKSSSYLPASPDMSASVSAGEEPGAKKRKTSHGNSPAVDSIDARPGTPMSVGSENSTSSKIKLKIKFGADDTSHDSASDILPKHTTNVEKQDDVNLKKMKKKKKKKHKHKDKKDRDKIDISNTPIPGAKAGLLDDRLAASSPPVLFDARDMKRQQSHDHVTKGNSFDTLKSSSNVEIMQDNDSDSSGG